MVFPSFFLPQPSRKNSGGRDQFQNKDIKISRKGRWNNRRNPVSFKCAGQVSDADVATCVDTRTTVARRVVTIAASIPEDAADSPASSEYSRRHRRAPTWVCLEQRLPWLALRVLKTASENFSCRVSFPRIENELFP